ncbi:MAG: glycosyltransferase, partial [Euryarchaeota archaeon]|nr:glycosyltransferase [Euryarchaeota archaeon]
ERLASELGVAGKVTFMGRVSEETKRQLQSKCKILVMPSTIEAYGIVAAEGMSYGKPVVASRIGGLPEVVGDCGMLTEPRDSRSLEEAINSLLSDGDLRRRIGEKARRRAMEFSWDKAADAMERVYEECIGSS